MTTPKSDSDRIARMELRMKQEEKDIIERAASLGGEDTSSFVRRTALVEARSILSHARR